MYGLNQFSAPAALRFRLEHSLFLLISILLTAGCASNIPKEIQQPPSGNPMVGEVRANIIQFTGARVRWGGVIAGVENQNDETRIEIVARKLSGSGRPQDSDYSPGRFIAVIPGFLDPMVFAKEREITISGAVSKSTSHPIGQYTYTYPVIGVNQYHLWSPLPKGGYNPYPQYGYGPGFYPWHHPYPYRHYYPY